MKAAAIFKTPPLLKLRAEQLLIRTAVLSGLKKICAFTRLRRLLPKPPPLTGSTPPPSDRGGRLETCSQEARRCAADGSEVG